MKYRDLQHYRSQLKYLIFRLNEEEEEILLDTIATNEATFDDFIAHFPDNDVRWGGMKPFLYILCFFFPILSNFLYPYHHFSCHSSRQSSTLITVPSLALLGVALHSLRGFLIHSHAIHFVRPHVPNQMD
jgi:hypothetical protein